MRDIPYDKVIVSKSGTSVEDMRYLKDRPTPLSVRQYDSRIMEEAKRAGR
jgi:hypothetical protein